MICCVVIVCADVGVNVAGVRLCECSCVRSVNYFVVCEFVCSFRFPSPYKLSRDRKNIVESMIRVGERSMSVLPNMIRPHNLISGPTVSTTVTKTRTSLITPGEKNKTKSG